MAGLKTLARILPQPLRAPVRAAWRRFRGNPESHMLRLLADRDRAAIDVGANAGVYTVLLGQVARTCVAFEPNPPLAKVAREAAAAQRLSNVRVEECALSDRDTTVTFRVPVVDGVEAGALATIEDSNRLEGKEVRSYTVPCRRLDGFDFEPVGVMKVDAEGHETAILEGARALVARDRPAVMIEVEERHKQGSVDWVRQFFAGYGYKGWFLLGRRLVPLDRFDVGEHQDPANVEGDAIRFNAVYVNNFVFAADEARIALLDKLARSGRAL